MSYKSEKNARSWRIRITYSAPLLKQNRTQIFNFLNTLAASSIIFACGGGGGDNTPAVAALELEITTPDGRKIKLDGADLVPEESAGNGAAGSSTAAISLGKITSNKNDTSDTTYEMATGDDTAGTQNEHFVIIGGALLYMGPAVDFETASVADRMFTIKINRYTNADDAANDRNAQPITAVIDLINGADLSDFPAPSGLFLRTTNTDGETRKVYSGGDSTITQSDIETAVPTRNLNTLDYGVLAAGENGSTNPVLLGTLAHDTLQADDDNSDGITVAIAFALVANPDVTYSNDAFSITNNLLSYIGANSGTYGQTPPYKLSIGVEVTVIMELPALEPNIDGYYDVDASGDTTDSDTREFSFSGGALSKTDVAATASNDAHRNIDVTAGKIYAADFANVAGKIISFAADTLRLPATPDIYQYHIIVDGTGEVSAVADLPTDGTEFYVLGTTETYEVPNSITLGERIVFTDKNDDDVASYDIKVRLFYNDLADSMVTASADGDTITISVGGVFTTYKSVVDALDIPEVKALVTVTTTDAYTGGGTEFVVDTGLLEYLLSGGGSDTKAQVNIGGLIIEAATVGVSATTLAALSLSANDDSVTITQNGTNIGVLFGKQATLADMITAINEGTSQDAIDANALINFVGEAGTDYDPNTLLADVLFALHSFAEAGEAEALTLKPSTEDPTTNDTGTEQTGAHTWTDEATLDPEDYTIKLAPSAEESVPSVAEATPDTDESAAEATPEAEATKPSIGRRILDWLFGSQEEHRQMQTQQAENMFGDTLDDLNPQDPDIL